VHVGREQALAELKIDIEPDPACTDPKALVQKLEAAFQDQLSLRVSVRLVSSLPRFELKAKRWLRDF
jgi:phenylacetate-coenzyme A ligase PaaK-like adenylate-forming protein